MLGNDKDQRCQSEFFDFFVEQLKECYWMEQQLTKALPKMQKASTSPQLAAAFEKHTRETLDQITVLDTVFDLLGIEADEKKSDAMAGLIKEAEKVISDTEKDSFTRDAGLILAGQRVEHYEIAMYGTLRIFAGDLNNEEVKDLLTQILNIEKATDVSLTILAEDSVNALAAAE
ncbi:MAG: ferritin-like domain-containing protein [Tannerellaceae bacterium]|nr:ferritin-like domain-containing protein [Tannerellaceae bacterium]